MTMLNAHGSFLFLPQPCTRFRKCQSYLAFHHLYHHHSAHLSSTHPGGLHHRYSSSTLQWPSSNRKPYLHICRSSFEENGRRKEFSFVESLLKGFNLGQTFFSANFLPSILVSAVLLGLAYPRLGQQAYHAGLNKWSTSCVFLISGLTLRTNELGDILKAWPSLLFGMVSTLIITPCLAMPVLQVPLLPQEFTTGLALFCCMPTTLSSGVSLTQVAGANTALALSLTLLSNLLGILTIPLMISRLVAPGLGILIPARPLMQSLMETSLLPLLIGKVVRAFVSGFIDSRKNELSILSSCFLAIVPWMQVSCGRNLFLSLKLRSFVAAAGLGMGVHCVFLLWNFVAMQALQSHIKSKDTYQQKRDAWAIIITASQKTLPVAVAVIGSLAGAMGESGLLVLPCLIAHITQIILDSFLVRLWIQDDLLGSLDTKH